LIFCENEEAHSQEEEKEVDFRLLGSA